MDFNYIRIVNLAERTDRKKDMLKSLNRAKISHAEFFPAIKVSDADGFRTKGARGCFLSHLSVLRMALEQDWDNVLVMEDDLEISPLYNETIKHLNNNWDICYLGINKDLSGLHFYAVNKSVLPELVMFLESLLNGIHPTLGKMDVDGAIYEFRKEYTCKVKYATPVLGWQRASTSDITPTKFSNIPGIKYIRAVKNLLTMMAL